MARRVSETAKTGLKNLATDKHAQAILRLYDNLAKADHAAVVGLVSEQKTDPTLTEAEQGRLVDALLVHRDFFPGESDPLGPLQTEATGVLGDAILIDQAVAAGDRVLAAELARAWTAIEARIAANSEPEERTGEIETTAMSIGLLPSNVVPLGTEARLTAALLWDETWTAFVLQNLGRFAARRALAPPFEKNDLEGGPLATAESTLAVAVEASHKNHPSPDLDTARAVLAAISPDTANSFSERENHRWTDPLYWATWLALALWPRVKEQLERAKNSRAGVVRAVAVDRLLPAMERNLSLFEERKRTVWDRRGRPVATIEEGFALDLAHRGLDRLATVHGHRFIRGLVHRSYDAWEAGREDPRRVVFTGGKRAVADAIGIAGGKYAAVVDELLAVGLWRWKTPHIAGGGLWTWTETRGTRAGPGEVAIVLGDALVPGYANELSGDRARSVEARRARRLVPELRFEPPTGTLRHNEAGAAWTLHRLLLVELVDHAEDLYRNGLVTMTAARWRKLAARARLPYPTLDRLLSAWVDGETDTAPPLIRRDGDGVTLADSHALERDFIQAGGQRRLEGRAGGRKGRRQRS